MSPRVVTLSISLTLALALAWETTAQQAPPSLKGSIEGVVFRTGTGEPVEGAQVTVGRANVNPIQILPPAAPPPPPPPPPLAPPSSVPAPPGTAGTAGAVGTSFSTFTVAPLGSPALPGAIPAVTTDSNGKFVLRDLDAGTYRLTIAANGYARQEYGQRVFPGTGTSVTLDAGESLKGLTISLLQAGNVSGRLRDLGGRAAVGVPVQLLKPVYNASGQRTFQAAGTSRTNDRGEYRLYWITPGRYYINAGSGPGPINRPAPLGGGPASPNEISTDSYTMTFYPGVVDLNFANAVDVQPGSEVAGIDFAVGRQQLRKIRGRVIDSRTGQAPAAVTMTLAYSNLAGGGGSFGSGQNYNAAAGTFELRDVVPGSYVVQASVQEAATAADPIGARAAASNAVRASVAINVSDADVENIVLTVTPPASISGKISVEGQALAALQGLDRIRVQLRLAGDSVPILNPSGGAPTPQPPAADGTFRVDGVVPGEYIMAVTGIPPGHYVKDARFDQTDILSKPMQFLGSSSSTVEIVLSPRAAQIDGRVLDSKLQPMPGVQAVLIPDNARKRFDLYKPAITDKTGAFSFSNLPPGDYKIFSWEALESFAYFDPGVLQQYEPKARPVHVSEGAKENIDVSAIPAGGSR